MKTISFLFDKDLYDKKSLLMASYRFTDNFYIHLSSSEKTFCVELTPKNNENISENEFKNELISQMVKQYILEQTKDIRTILMARALSSSMIDESPEIPQNPQLNKYISNKILNDWFENNE